MNGGGEITIVHFTGHRQMDGDLQISRTHTCMKSIMEDWGLRDGDRDRRLFQKLKTANPWRDNAKKGKIFTTSPIWCIRISKHYLYVSLYSPYDYTANHVISPLIGLSSSLMSSWRWSPQNAIMLCCAVSLDHHYISFDDVRWCIPLWHVRSPGGG
jgi:hypothetical protein